MIKLLEREISSSLKERVMNYYPCCCCRDKCYICEGILSLAI